MITQCQTCQGDFNRRASEKFCSDICALKGQSTRKGDCWPGKSIHRNTAYVNFHGKCQTARAFLADLLGITLTRSHIYRPTCGDHHCLNPDHFAVTEKRDWKPNKTGGKRQPLERAAILQIYNDPRSYKEIMQTWKVSRALVSRIKNGKIHQQHTGHKEV